MGLEEELAKNQKVILFDNRGMGESSVASSDDPISMDLMAKDTIALVKHLGIKQFNLLGWSMGGCIALCIALNMPSDLKLEKLIICSSFAKRNQVTAYFKNLYDLPELDFPKSVQEQKDSIMKTFEKNYTDYLLEHPDKLDKLAEIRFNAHRPFKIFKRQWEAMDQLDFVSGLPTIKTPTLIIHGEADETILIEEGEILAHGIPNAKLVKIPKIGHMILVMDCEPEPAALINNFLRV